MSDDNSIRDERGIARVWELGLDEAYSRNWQDTVTPNDAGIDCTDAFAEGAEWGAGWLAAVIGLGVALQERVRRWS